ncbi:MAG: PadR family transcriptional regulator [Alphaproteobacteria bacterium]|nr:PadR family transcriptional regulator [Alphaproteobacteria bacterium]
MYYDPLYIQTIYERQIYRIGKIMDVRTFCLGVLSLGDATGYEIKKQAEDGPFSHFYKAGFGSIYPALARLAADGLIVGRDEAQAGKPDKRVYALTPAGSAALADALTDHATGVAVRDDIRSEFLFLMFFAHLMPAHRVARQIDAHIALYRECLGHIEERARDPECAHKLPGHVFVRGVGLAVYRALHDYLRDNRDALLAELSARRQDAAE